MSSKKLKVKRTSTFDQISLNVFEHIDENEITPLNNYHELSDELHIDDEKDKSYHYGHHDNINPLLGDYNDHNSAIRSISLLLIGLLVNIKQINILNILKK